jgi:hypothetical protein
MASTRKNPVPLAAGRASEAIFSAQDRSEAIANRFRIQVQEAPRASFSWEKPAGHPDRSVDHYDRSQRRPYGKHFLPPDNYPPPWRLRVYQGRAGDWGVSIWLRSEKEAGGFAGVAEAILRKGARP